MSDILYSVVHSERKTMSIIIERDRSVLVRAPKHMTQERIATEIQKRKRLIQEKINKTEKYPNLKETKEFVSGESLLYLGNPYQLLLIDEPIEGVVFDTYFYISKAAQSNANVLFKAWYMKAAHAVIVPKVKYFATLIGVNYRNINIMDLKYRWGSCTPKDNIHFNWRLIKAPLSVIEYIIVHELTHLVEANHTPVFWNRIATVLPSYEQSKNWLREHGGMLEVDF